VFVRLADVSPLTAAFFRGAYALPVLAALYLLGRDRDARTSRERLLAVAAGMILAVDLALYNLSILSIGAGLSTLLANLQVVWVALAAWALHRERPAPITMLMLPVVFTGMVLISGLGRPDAYGDDPELGVVAGVSSALFYAAFILVYRAANRRLAPQAGPLLDVTIGTALGALTIGAFESGFDLAPAWPAHGWLLALALVTQVLGWLLIGSALPRLPALATSILILLQPALAIVWGAVIFDERFSNLQMTGVALVFVGVGTAAVRGRAPDVR
jgi:drug/metabolite transporter (DMT)-like permease